MVPNWLILMYDNTLIFIHSICVQKPLWMLLLILIAFRFSWVFYVNNYLLKSNFWFPIISSVQSLSCVRLLATPWTAAHQASLSITSSQSLLKLMSIESVMPSNHLILCCPLLFLPSIFPSVRVFSNYTFSFSFPILLVRTCNTVSNRYNGSKFLICFWF